MVRTCRFLRRLGVGTESHDELRLDRGKPAIEHREFDNLATARKADAAMRSESSRL